MENNLDDFFNEKLNDFSSSNDGWDEPSESVWENAQPNFPTYEKSKRNWLAILAILLGLTLLGTGTYLYKVKQTNHALKQEMANLQNELNKNQSSNQPSNQSSNDALIRQNTLLQNQLDKAQLAFENERQNALQIVKNAESICAVSLKKAVENNSEKYQNVIETQQQQIKELAQANQKLQTENVKLNEELITVINKNSIDNQLASTKKLNNKSFIVESTASESIDFSNVERPEKTWKKYEFGVDVSSIGFNMELTNAIENVGDFQSQTMPMSNVDARASSSSASYYALNTVSTGFHFGYAPKENLYIRTGLRYAKFNIDNTIMSGIVYDDSNEYLDNQGQTVNDLVLSSSTPFSDIQQEITVEIPSGLALESGDILYSTLNNYQDYHFYQVPLGLAYYKGKKRWQIEFQGGLTWNYIQFGDYSFDADFKSDNINLPITDYDVVNNTTNSTSYLGAYLGVGANYRLSDSWQIRTGLTFEETSLRTNAQNFSKRYLLDGGLNLSLNYRF